VAGDSLSRLTGHYGRGLGWVRRAPGLDRQPDQQQQGDDAKNLLLFFGEEFHGAPVK
jgi:hypothetical protein